MIATQDKQSPRCRDDRCCGAVALHAQPQANQSQGAIRVKPIEIIDGTGLERPMTAATMMIPVDWQAQGGVAWRMPDDTYVATDDALFNPADGVRLNPVP